MREMGLFVKVNSVTLKKQWIGFTVTELVLAVICTLIIGQTGGVLFMLKEMVSVAMVMLLGMQLRENVGFVQKMSHLEGSLRGGMAVMAGLVALYAGTVCTVLRFVAARGHRHFGLAEAVRLYVAHDIFFDGWLYQWLSAVVLMAAAVCVGMVLEGLCRRWSGKVVALTMLVIMLTFGFITGAFLVGHKSWMLPLFGWIAVMAENAWSFLALGICVTVALFGLSVLFLKEKETEKEEEA